MTGMGRPEWAPQFVSQLKPFKAKGRTIRKVK